MFRRPSMRNLLSGDVVVRLTRDPYANGMASNGGEPRIKKALSSAHTRITVTEYHAIGRGAGVSRRGTLPRPFLPSPEGVMRSLRVFLVAVAVLAILGLYGVVRAAEEKEEKVAL